MARNKELIAQRNINVRERFRHHRKKNPKWTIYAVISETATEFYLSEATVTKILKGQDEKVPEVVTVIKHTSSTT